MKNSHYKKKFLGEIREIEEHERLGLVSNDCEFLILRNLFKHFLLLFLLTWGHKTLYFQIFSRKNIRHPPRIRPSTFFGYKINRKSNFIFEKTLFKKISLQNFPPGFLKINLNLICNLAKSFLIYLQQNWQFQRAQ